MEFAVKLPGDGNRHVWLPIDSKFPMDSYANLQQAYQTNQDVKLHQKKFHDAIIQSAKEISGKYINPPATTDFAVMFFPAESIFAEVLRDSALFHLLQSNYRVTITGPTTMAALLNSLRMGFQTLEIQKRSHEVWNVLHQVKQEFNKYHEALLRAQKQVQQVSNTIDDLVSTRQNQMIRKLDKIGE